MVEEKSSTQIMQDKVDKLKLLNLANNIHNLNLPQNKEPDGSRDIALVNVLSSSKRISQKFLEIRGLEYDPIKKELVQITEPIMNLLGAYRFCKLLQMAEEIEWASYSEDEIKNRIIHFYEENIPYFLFWHEEYELKERDFYYIVNTLQTFIDSAFHKAKSGKFINTLSRTYGEDVLRKALDTEPNKKKEESGFMSKYNPFRGR